MPKGIQVVNKDRAGRAWCISTIELLIEEFGGYDDVNVTGLRCALCSRASAALALCRVGGSTPVVGALVGADLVPRMSEKRNNAFHLIFS